MEMRKSVNQEPSVELIEEICREVFISVRDLTENHLVNKDLIFANKDNFIQTYHDYNNQMDNLKIKSARAWLVFLVFTLLALNEIFQKKEPDVTVPIALSAVFLLLLRVYEVRFGAMPLEYVGTNLFLKKEEAEICERERQFNMTFLQAITSSTLNSLTLFFPNPLLKAVTLREMTHAQHNAIMRCLYGLKNKSFDCIGVSTLVILGLIEQGLPASIICLGTDKLNIRGHYYVIVNLSPESKIRDISTWNDDAKLIDAWYGIHVRADEIKNDPNFFYTYPLLDPRDKFVKIHLLGNHPPKAYQFAVSEVKKLRDQFKETKAHVPSHLEMILPRLPKPI